MRSHVNRTDLSQCSAKQASISVCTDIKFAMLALKTYVGDSKINSAKKLPPMGIELGTSSHSNLVDLKHPKIVVFC